MLDLKAQYPSMGVKSVDSTTAIRAAESALRAGTSVGLAQGYYLYDNPLVWSADWIAGTAGARLFGEGSENTWLVAKDPTKPAIHLQQYNGDRHWAGHIKGLSITFATSSNINQALQTRFSAYAWPGGWPSNGAAVFAGDEVTIASSSFRDINSWTPGPALWAGTDFSRSVSFSPPSFVSTVENWRARSAWYDIFGVYGGNSWVFRNCYAGTAGLIPNSGLAGYRAADHMRLDDCTGLDEGAIWGLFGAIAPVSANSTAATASSVTANFGDFNANQMIGQEIRCLTGPTSQGPRRIVSHTGDTYQIRPNWGTTPPNGTSMQLFSPLSPRPQNQKRGQITITGGNVERPADYGILAPFQCTISMMGVRFFGTQDYRSMIRVKASSDAHYHMNNCRFANAGASMSHGEYIVADGAANFSATCNEENSFLNLDTNSTVTIPLQSES